MKNKMIGSYYPKCNSKKTNFLKNESLDGEIYVSNGNLVFQRKILYFFKGNNRLEIPVKDIERVENCNLNKIFPYGVCIFTKDKKEYMLGHVNNKKLQDFIMNAKAGVIKEVKENHSNTKKKKIVNIILSLLLITIFIITVLMAFNNIKQERIIKNELKIINTLHASKDTIDMKIKSNGYHSKVEKAIKEYYEDFFNKKKIFNNNRAESLFNTFTIDYLKENKSKLKKLKLDKMIDTKTRELNTAVDGIIQMLDGSNIMSYVYKYDLKNYYNNFYRKNMVSKNDNVIKEEWTNLKELNSQKIGYLKEILKILIDNNEDWYIKDDNLYFSNDKILDKYNKLHSLIYDIDNDSEINSIVF